MADNNQNISKARELQLEQLRMLQMAGRLPSNIKKNDKPVNKPKVTETKKTTTSKVKVTKTRPVEKKKEQVVQPVPKKTKVNKDDSVDMILTPSDRKRLKFYGQAAIILAIMGIGGYTLYKSGIPQDIYNHFKVKSSYERLANNTQDTSEIIEIPIVEPSESPDVTEEVEEVEYIGNELFESGYEFNQNLTPSYLKEINPILSRSTAWIEIPGTKINYPFVIPGLENIDSVPGLKDKIIASGMSEAEYMNNYFLHVDINGTNSDWGCPYQSIYTQELNQHSDVISDMSVIYAHHMSDGSMFSGLDKWKKDKDGTYNAEHPYGVIYTDDGMCYKLTFITSAVVNGADGNCIKIGDFDSVEDKQQYINDFIAKAKSQGCYTMDSYEVDDDTKFMALFTCSYANIYNNPTNSDKFVLIGVLEKQMVMDVHIDGYEIGKEKER